MPIQLGGSGFHRSMRFRFNVVDDQQPALEQRATELINAAGYRISDFRDYDLVADLGSDRFLGAENHGANRARQRAELVTDLYYAISKLVIDALGGPDAQGRFRLERNDDLVQNPRGSTFQSLLHLFCNITDVPTDVYVFRKPALNTFVLGTFMYPPDPPPEGWEEVTAFPIRF